MSVAIRVSPGNASLADRHGRSPSLRQGWQFRRIVPSRILARRTRDGGRQNSRRRAPRSPLFLRLMAPGVDRKRRLPLAAAG
jgi:hypothetical protein